MHERPIGAGKSSYDLIDATKFIEALRIGKETVLLDLGCGTGRYSIALAETFGEAIQIYALDLWREGIALLQKEGLTRGLKNVNLIISDLRKGIPLAKASVDACLIATVLHDLVQIEAAKTVLEEVRRVLRHQGSLAVVEFKKREGPPGPPIGIRLTPEEVDAIVYPYGFSKKRLIEIGPFTYLMTFSA